MLLTHHVEEVVLVHRLGVLHQTSLLDDQRVQAQLLVRLLNHLQAGRQEKNGWSMSPVGTLNSVDSHYKTPACWGFLPALSTTYRVLVNVCRSILHPS